MGPDVKPLTEGVLALGAKLDAINALLGEVLAKLDEISAKLPAKPGG